MTRINRGIIESALVADDEATRTVCGRHDGLAHFHSLCQRALNDDTRAWRVAAKFIREIDMERRRVGPDKFTIVYVDEWGTARGPVFDSLELLHQWARDRKMVASWNYYVERSFQLRD